MQKYDQSIIIIINPFVLPPFYVEEEEEERIQIFPMNRVSLGME
jgi:hypothetical protein